MAFTGKQRAELRGKAHHLEPIVHIGQHGLTDRMIASLDDALRTHELVKIQVGRNTDGKPKDIAPILATRVEARVVQVIGRTVTLYRENPELRKPVAPSDRKSNV